MGFVTKENMTAWSLKQWPADHLEFTSRDAITAEKVRETRGETGINDGERREYFYETVLKGLLAHNGVSSSARAVIEEALK